LRVYCGSKLYLNFFFEKFGADEKRPIFAPLLNGPFIIQLKRRELSSVGSEHLPYKQRVDGSNPSVPTMKSR
jgi:hypothetical protein